MERVTESVPRFVCDVEGGAVQDVEWVGGDGLSAAVWLAVRLRVREDIGLMDGVWELVWDARVKVRVAAHVAESDIEDREGVNTALRDSVSEPECREFVDVGDTW